MRGIKVAILLIGMVFVFAQPVYAAEADILEGYTPEEGLTSGEIEQIGAFSSEPDFLQSLKSLLLAALDAAKPSFLTGIKTCGILLSAVLLCGVFQVSDKMDPALNISGALIIAAISAGPLNSVIHLGTNTITRLYEYGILLFPALSSLFAATGAMSSAAVSYTGNLAFLEVIMTVTAKLFIPVVWLFYAVSIADSALDNGMLGRFRDFLKWAGTGLLRIVSYVFTGYITLSGILTTASDAARLRAARVTISGAVPVVGGIVSEASGTLLTTAELLRTSVGSFGMLGILAICLTPFFEIGIQYLLLKLTTALSGLLGRPCHVTLLEQLTSAVGLLVAATGICAMMLLLMIGICMKAVGTA